MKVKTRDFDVTVNGITYPFKGKLRSEVDGMGTRIINVDNTIAFSGTGSIQVVETGEGEVEVDDPVFVTNPAK